MAVLSVVLLNPDGGVDGGAPTVEGSPVLFQHPGDGEWGVMLPCGTALSDLAGLNEGPAGYGPIVNLLSELAHTLNVDSSPEACRIAQALLGDDQRARSAAEVA